MYIHKVTIKNFRLLASILEGAKLRKHPRFRSSPYHFLDAMYIELKRTFRELLRNEEQGDNAGALSPGTNKLTLPNLLNEFRMITRHSDRPQ